MDALERIGKIVNDNAVVVFMKGTPQLPQCGFSSRTSEALMACGKEFAHVNVLADPDIFQTLPQFADCLLFHKFILKASLLVAVTLP